MDSGCRGWGRRRPGLRSSPSSSGSGSPTLQTATGDPLRWRTAAGGAGTGGRGETRHRPPRQPLSALDPVTQEKFIADLERLHQEDGLTIVQVSHSRREAHFLATRMAVIIDGALVDEGEASVVLNAPKSREVASFIGIENILDGTVTANDGGHAAVDAGGLVFEALTDAAAGEEVTLCIRADDVVVAVGEGPPSSARNTMAGTIVQIVENGPIAEVRVDAGVALTAVLTRRSVQDLGLAPGIPVALSVKATAIHVIHSF